MIIIFIFFGMRFPSAPLFSSSFFPSFFSLHSVFLFFVFAKQTLPPSRLMEGAAAEAAARNSSVDNQLSFSKAFVTGIVVC